MQLMGGVAGRAARQLAASGSRAHAPGSQSVTNSVVTKVTFDTQDFDLSEAFGGNEYDPTTNYRFTASVRELLEVKGYVRINAVTAGAVMEVKIRKNGADYSENRSWNFSGADQNIACEVVDEVILDPGEWVEIWVVHGSAAAKTVDATSFFTVSTIAYLPPLQLPTEGRLLALAGMRQSGSQAPRYAETPSLGRLLALSGAPQSVPTELKQAQAGSAGVPGTINRFVTEQDSRIGDRLMALMGAAQSGPQRQESTSTPSQARLLALMGAVQSLQAELKAALLGTSDFPGDVNRFVTDKDSRARARDVLWSGAGRLGSQRPAYSSLAALGRLLALAGMPRSQGRTVPGQIQVNASLNPIGTEPIIDFLDGNGFSWSIDDNVLSPGAIGIALFFTTGTITVPFTDGDTVRRVSVSDAAITGAAYPLVFTPIRPSTADDNADAGHYVYVPTVVEIDNVAHSFDVLIQCLSWGDDPAENPPNETITLRYLVAI